jgi:hypothetical protein
MRALVLMIVVAGGCKKSEPHVVAPKVGSFVIKTSGEPIHVEPARYKSLLRDSPPHEWYSLADILGRVLPGQNVAAVEIVETGGALHTRTGAEIAQCKMKLNQRGEFRFQLGKGNVTVDEIRLR